jgi:hypothetical protein
MNPPRFGAGWKRCIMERIREGKCDPMASTFFGMIEKSVRELIDVGHKVGVRPTTGHLQDSQFRKIRGNENECKNQETSLLDNLDFFTGIDIWLFHW